MDQSETRHVSHDELKTLLDRIFVVHGCAPLTAELVAANVAGAERDGALSHGIFRMKGHVETLKSGWIDADATPDISDVAAALVRVDARNTYAQRALHDARDLLVDKAHSAGVAVLAIHNSQHFAALWPDVEPFAEHGFIALSMVNSMAVVTPPGGHHPVYGTNPIAMAVPRAHAEPLVFDQASSAMAHGDVQIAAREQRALPEGVGVDKNGQPTTDASAILDGGALLPFGGYKGGSIAMMIELMAAAFTGGQFSFEVDWSSHPGAAIPRTGQFLMLIDPQCGAPTPFVSRVETLISALEDAGVSRLPGARRHQTRIETDRNGIPIADTDWQALLAMAKP